MTRMVLVLTVAAFLAWLGGLIAPGMWDLPETGSRLDRDLYYSLTPGGIPLRLKVQPGNTQLKLAMFVVLEGDVPLDPKYIVPFCLDAALENAEGEVTWMRHLCYESARSGAVEPSPPENPGPGRAVERSWLRDLPGRLTDPRLEELDLGILEGNAGVLTLKAEAGVASSILVRPYRLERLPPSQVLLRSRGLPERQRRRLAQQAGVASWQELAPSERRKLVEHSWLRQEALGARGVDYHPVIVLTRDLPIASARRTTGGWMSLTPGGAYAVNLRGPTKLLVQVQGKGLVELKTTTQYGTVHSQELEAAEFAVEKDIDFKSAEVATLALINHGDYDLNVRILSIDVLGTLFAGTRAGLEPDSGMFSLEPDRSSGRLSYLEPGESTDFAMGSSAARRARVKFRQVASFPVDVRVVALDPYGEELLSTELKADFVASSFEGIQRNLPGARIEPTSDAQIRELWLPKGTQWIRVLATQPTYVRVQVPVSEEWLPTEPQEEYLLDTEGVTLRYQPLAGWNWQTLPPEHHYAPQAIGKWGHFTAQIRLEQKKKRGGFGPAAADWSDELLAERRRGVSWRPEGESRRLRIFEALPADHEHIEGSWAQMTLGKTRRVQVSEKGVMLRLWKLGGQQPQSPLPVYVDGRLHSLIDLDAARIDRRLGTISEGSHKIRVGDGGQGLRILLDASSDDGLPLFRARTLYRLSNEADLSVRLNLPQGQRVVVLMLPYFEPGTEPYEGAQVSFGIKGRTSAKSTSFPRTTARQGRHPLTLKADSVGFPVDRGAARITRGDSVAVRVFEDMGGGDVRVRFRRADKGKEIWARFVVLGLPAQKSTQHTEQWVENVAVNENLSWVDPYEDLPSLKPSFEELQTEPNGPFRPASKQNLASVRRFARVAAAVAIDGNDAMIEELGREAERLGFRIRAIRVKERRYLLLSSVHNDGRSALYLAMGGDRAPVILQTPHIFADMHTGWIGLRLFESGKFRAWQINTRHRRVAEGDPNPSDLSHNKDTYFQALMEGLVDELGRGAVVQIHGFGRESVPESSIHLVLSGGAQGRHKALDCFTQALGPDEGMALFGKDIERLGATTNVQGLSLKARKTMSFIHVESSPERRKQWLFEADSLTPLRTAISAAATCDQQAPP